MKILRKNQNLNLILNQSTDFKTDLGWSENFEDYEKESLEKVINTLENYETIRYIHEPYSGLTTNPNNLQSDIWFYFYFNDNGTYVQNYEPTGLSNRENSNLLKETTKSFFRLEFYKTPNDEEPNRINRKFVFAKNLTIPLGEKYYLNTDSFKGYIHAPVFTGSNYRNKENMYLFWFQDDSAFQGTLFTGNTFFMTARYFNATNGQIIDLVNKDLTQNPSLLPSERRGFRTSPVKFYEKGIQGGLQINEGKDLYYRMVIDRTNYTYRIYFDET